MNESANMAAICISVACLAPVLFLLGAPTESIPVATGFDFPVGKPGAGGYDRVRTFTPDVYPAERWHRVAGSDTDLDDPVYSIDDGEVVVADKCRLRIDESRKNNYSTGLLGKGHLGSG
jgi:hypothetical protein